MLIDISISCWNFKAKLKSWLARSTFTATGFVSKPRSGVCVLLPLRSSRVQSMSHFPCPPLHRLSADADYSLWYNRLIVPRFLFDIQKVYPIMALCLFTILNGLLCLCNNTVTALCFSPAVANAWKREASRPHIRKLDKEECSWLSLRGQY